VHCLAYLENLTWDHLFPVSWYPASTPENLEKWQVPACEQCNSEYGNVERDLLEGIGLCFDPDELAAAGISRKVLRALDPSQAKDEQEARIRKAKRETAERGRRV
jgi:hypothetical protein